MTQKPSSGHHLTTLSSCIFATIRHVSTIGKIVKQQYILHMSSQYGECRPTNGWDLFGCLGHLSKFQRVSRPGFVTAPTSLTGSQPNFAWSLAVSWAGTPYIHFQELLRPDGILPRAKFTLRPSLAISYISSVTARHTSSGRQPNFAALSRGRHLHSAGWLSRLALAHNLVF